MNVLVVGAGAIGTWLSAVIGRCGHWVTCAGRPPFVDVAGRDGITVQMADERGGMRAWTTRNFGAVSSVAEAVEASEGVFAAPYDAVLVCVKAYDVDAVIQELRLHRARLCKPDAAGIPRTLFVCLQNGVGSEEAFAAVFGPQYVVGATTTSPISIISPAVVRVERTGGIMALATMRPQDTPRVDHSAIEADLKTHDPHPFTLLVDVFRQSILPCRVYSHYRELKWSKLLLNTLGNATGAILDMPAEALYADARLFGFEMHMLRETIAVMRALDVSPVNLPRFPAATLTWVVRLLPDTMLRPVLRRRVAHGRGDKRPSFYYDVTKQQGKSEVTYLNGAVVAYGRRLGIPTPVNARLTEVLTGLVNGELQPDDWRGRVDQLLATGQTK